MNWWKEVIVRDASEGSLLRCVFCSRDLGELIKASVLSQKGDSAAMMAWWTSDEVDGDSNTVFASGLYCHGTVNDRCLNIADNVGMLFDVHVEGHTGLNAMQTVRRILSEYKQWQPDALRRFVLVMGELSQLPSKRVR